jgi:DNA transposition AAA+ family ATPase
MQQLQHSGGFQPTRNVTLLMELVHKVMRRIPGQHGIGCFFGYTGLGKTAAANYAVQKTRGYYVEMCDIWTKKTLLEMIVREMNIEPAKTAPKLLEQLAKQLSLSNRPLFIDECDIIMSKGYEDTLRSIYEKSQGTIILIGEEKLQRDMKNKSERLFERVHDWVQAQPTDMSDARLLARKYCPSVPVRDCRLEEMLQETHQNARRMVHSLSLAHEWALQEGAAEITAAGYTGKKWTGEVFKMRKFV